jgi:hypothetical protein
MTYWTTETPTESGWYWWKPYENCKYEAVRMWTSCTSFLRIGYDESTPVGKYEDQWHGPIKPEEEQAKVLETLHLWMDERREKKYMVRDKYEMQMIQLFPEPEPQLLDTCQNCGELVEYAADHYKYDDMGIDRGEFTCAKPEPQASGSADCSSICPLCHEPEPCECEVARPSGSAENNLSGEKDLLSRDNLSTLLKCNVQNVIEQCLSLSSQLIEVLPGGENTGVAGVSGTGEPEGIQNQNHTELETRLRTGQEVPCGTLYEAVRSTSRQLVRCAELLKTVQKSKDITKTTI